MKQVIEALVGQKVRIVRTDNFIKVGTLLALGFGTDDIYDPATGEEDTKKFLSRVFTISHAAPGAFAGQGTLYIGIKEFGDTAACHNADYFELVTKSDLTLEEKVKNRGAPKCIRSPKPKVKAK